jgi:hypothetical protein
MNIDLTTILVIAGAIIAGESPWRSSKHGLDNYAGETQARRTASIAAISAPFSSLRRSLHIRRAQ